MRHLIAERKKTKKEATDHTDSKKLENEENAEESETESKIGKKELLTSFWVTPERRLQKLEQFICGSRRTLQLRKKRKNMSGDEIGDKMGRFHVSRQDLSNLALDSKKGLGKEKRL